MLEEPPELQTWDDEGDDEEPLSADLVGQTVATDTDWTVETVLAQLWRGNIRLNPRFQRRDAWSRQRKSKFIESLILGFPVPQIVLAEERGRRGSFLVLDGKQRLLTLLQFAEGSLESQAKSIFTDVIPLTLSKDLEIRPDLAGYNLKKFESYGPEADMYDFLNQTVRTVVVRNWPSEDLLNSIFLRLNTGSVPLSPQELRQALHPGPFTDFVDEFTFNSQQIRRILRLKQPDFRMRDVELVLRYFAFQYQLETYSGNLKKFLDDTTKLLNKDWDQSKDGVEKAAGEMSAAIDATFEIFEDRAFRRWNSLTSTFETRLNRAVFDVMLYFFRDSTIRDRAIGQRDLVVSAFSELCTEDDHFAETLQFTTKSIEATFYRLRTWGEKLAKTLAIEVPLPSRSSNH